MSGDAAVSRVVSTKADVAASGPLGVADRAAVTRPWTATIVTGPDDERGSATFAALERWRAARDRWSQLTFYLFDPDSWR